MTGPNAEDIRFNMTFGITNTLTVGPPAGSQATLKLRFTDMRFRVNGQSGGAGATGEGCPARRYLDRAGEADHVGGRSTGAHNQDQVYL